jgi:hypothetical protein
MLSTMQMMQHFIKSGVGISKEPVFGASIFARLMGLGQGSGAALIGVRSMIILWSIMLTRDLGMGCAQSTP